MCWWVFRESFLSVGRGSFSYSFTAVFFLSKVFLISCDYFVRNTNLYLMFYILSVTVENKSMIPRKDYEDYARYINEQHANRK